jgi:hypothetical protein
VSVTGLAGEKRLMCVRIRCVGFDTSKVPGSGLKWWIGGGGFSFSRTATFRNGGGGFDEVSGVIPASFFAVFSGGLCSFELHLDFAPLDQGGYQIETVKYIVGDYTTPELNMAMIQVPILHSYFANNGSFIFRVVNDGAENASLPAGTCVVNYLPLVIV